ncbi:MAG: AAA family ATPase, partial [Elusimicrobia bacterium]|nr:AAA family ATPase [Elusimicrobiota bacterium]
LLETALDARLPIILWGPPAVGKSAVVAAAASARRLALIDLRLAQLDAADLRGIPVPDHSSRRVRWYPPAFLPGDGGGILFLDEIDKAPALVKSAALQLVLDRAIGDYRLPEGWRIVCAGNREEDNAFASPLGSALANRMLHAEVEPDLDTWVAWAKDNGIHDDITAFLRFRAELLYKQTGEHAFPSPRSWAAASRLWGSVESDSPPAPLIAAAVGGATASEFIGWAKVYRGVRVADILKGRLPKFPENDASFRYAVVLAVAGHIAKKGLDDGCIEHLGALLELVTPELRVLLFKSLPGKIVSRLAVHPAVRTVASKAVLDYVGR